MAKKKMLSPEAQNYCDKTFLGIDCLQLGKFMKIVSNKMEDVFLNEMLDKTIEIQDRTSSYINEQRETFNQEDFREFSEKVSFLQKELECIDLYCDRLRDRFRCIDRILKEK